MVAKVADHVIQGQKKKVKWMEQVTRLPRKKKAETVTETVDVTEAVDVIGAPTATQHKQSRKTHNNMSHPHKMTAVTGLKAVANVAVTVVAVAAKTAVVEEVAVVAVAAIHREVEHRRAAAENKNKPVPSNEFRVALCQP